MRVHKAIRGTGAVVLGAFLALYALPAATASASTVGGTATISAPGNTTALSGTQASETEFTVTLPTGAACSGDTVSDGYHEYSYLIPAGTLFSSLSFSSGFASNDLGLVDLNGNPWDGFNTNPVNGLVISIASDYEFGPLVSDGYLPLTGSGGLLYSGTTGVWEAGIACANSAGQLTDNWNTEVTFTSNSGDPNRFVWSAVPGLGSQGQDSLPEVVWAVTLPIVGAAILGSAIWMSRRRSNRRALLAQQPAG